MIQSISAMGHPVRRYVMAPPCLKRECLAPAMVCGYGRGEEYRSQAGMWAATRWSSVSSTHVNRGVGGDKPIHCLERRLRDWSAR